MRPDRFGRPGGPRKASSQHVIGLNTLPVLEPKLPLQTWMCGVEGVCSLMLAINRPKSQNWGGKEGRVFRKLGVQGCWACSNAHARINTKTS